MTDCCGDEEPKFSCSITSGAPECAREDPCRRPHVAIIRFISCHLGTRYDSPRLMYTYPIS